MDWVGNSNSVYKSLGASNHTAEEREENDYYATDPIAIDKLLTVESPDDCVWECAAGGGHLADRLIHYCFTVWASDIVDRGYKYLSEVSDFLAAEKTPFIHNKCDIITNPPYKYAKEFVLKALELLHSGSKCYMFLKLTFLEGKARYKELFSKYPPMKIYVFSERVLCAKNADFQKAKEIGGSAVAYAWYVWQKGYTGKTVVEWI